MLVIICSEFGMPAKDTSVECKNKKSSQPKKYKTFPIFVVFVVVRYMTTARGRKGVRVSDRLESLSVYDFLQFL